MDERHPLLYRSAGKSVVAFLTGIANQNGLININNKTADYLGAGWTRIHPIKKP
jgi:hypothetical protein